nr:reverse transcriptase domain-containing protein [Tanacetum cinerariifolium]
MDKICCGKRKEVHARLDFEENLRKSRKVREDSQNSSVGTLRYRNSSKRPKIRDRLKYNDEDVFDRLGHRRQSAFDRLSNTYSPTKTGPDEGNSWDRSHSRGHSRRWSSSSRDCPRNRNRPRGIEESYSNTRSSYRTRYMHGYHARNRNRSCSMKRGRGIESPLSRMSESGTSDDNFKSSGKTRMPNNMKTYDGIGDPENHLKIFQAAAQVERWAMPKWYHMFNSTLIGAARVWFDELPPESIDGYKGLKAAFLAYFMQQKKVTRQKVSQSFAHIKEITFPPLTANKGTEGPLVIKEKIGGYAIRRIYVDGGSSMELLYKHCFNQLRPKIKNQIVPATTSLTGFSGKTIWPLGQLRLFVTIGDTKHYTKAWINFMIVRSLSPYNDIIGRPEIREIQALPSTAHIMFKFSMNGGIVTIRSTILTPTECTTIVTTPKVTVKKAEARHRNFKVPIHPYFSDQEITIGGTVLTKARTELCTLLKRNLDIFAWQPSDMTSIPRSIAERRLNIQEGYSPVRQKNGGRPRSAPRRSN